MTGNKGYAIVPDVFASAETDALLGAIPSSGRAGTRHLMSNLAVAAAAYDARMLYLASQYVGATPAPFRATLFEKVEHANWLIAWHQDIVLPLAEQFTGDGWGPWSIKGGVRHAQAPSWALARVIALRLHLDDSTSTNGPLRVISGSHQDGLLSDSQILARAKQGPEVERTVPRGGVIAMRPLLIHASSKSEDHQPRRVLHIEYADALTLGPGIQLALT